jgi:hypothetical protein
MNKKIKNPPPVFNKWEIDMNDHNRKGELGEKVGREPQEP